MMTMMDSILGEGGYYLCVYTEHAGTDLTTIKQSCEFCLVIGFLPKVSYARPEGLLSASY